MLFNVKKCRAMHMGRQLIQRDYVMNGVRLETVEVEKDLGVIIRSDLKASIANALRHILKLTECWGLCIERFSTSQER